MTGGMEAVEGGVCATPGIMASGVAAGLKPSGKEDLALVAAPTVVAAAGVQTTNQVQAHPVTVTRRHLGDGRARAILLNAGSANVCTGPDGLALAERSAVVVAEALGCAPEDVLLCSTGVIGQPVPAEALLAGIPAAVAALSADGAAAARAIMTTDTAPKEHAVRATDDSGGACIVGGMAKGSGMIDPAMATMLCVLTTDAAFSAAALQSVLADVVARTFGRISVDGCMSTNDAVLLLATGAAERPASPAAFTAALTEVCGRLAESVVRDGEGAQKVVRIRVTEAASEAQAEALARAIGSSNLVKTAIAGGDPNWGRVLAAMGASPARFNPERVTVDFGDVTVCRRGAATGFDHGRAALHLRGADVDITVDVGAGEAEATFLTCDLTHGYITINADYTT